MASAIISNAGDLRIKVCLNQMSKSLNIVLFFKKALYRYHWLDYYDVIMIHKQGRNFPSLFSHWNAEIISLPQERRCFLYLDKQIA